MKNTTINAIKPRISRFASLVAKKLSNIWVNNGRPVPVDTTNTTKYNTFCCALSHISCGPNAHSEEIQFQLDQLKADNELVWNISTRASGETCAFVVTTPSEIELANKLEQLGFTKVWEFKRRNGYSQNGLLKLWIKNVV